MEENIENSTEAAKRCNSGFEKIAVEIYKNDDLFATASSLKQASDLTKVKLNAVFQRVSGRYTTPMNGWKFKKRNKEVTHVC